MDWYKIGSAVLLGGMLIYLLPAAKHMLLNSPKAKPGDWPAVIGPLLLVAGFIILLVAMVRG